MESTLMHPIKAQFELQNSWFLNSLIDISNEEAFQQPYINWNPILWIAGHIVNSRMSLLFILTGKKQDQNFNVLFGKGSSNIIDASYPTIDDIKTKWNAVSLELSDTLKNIREEKLLSPPSFQTSIPDNTLIGLIAYFAIHEGHHIGQISMMRKALGKQAMLMNRN